LSVESKLRKARTIMILILELVTISGIIFEVIIDIVALFL